jgi:hypothetical protein
MRTALVVAGLAGLIGLVAPVRAQQVDCEAARCAAQDAINQQCPCDGATNHGRHVSCVAHVIKQLVDAGQIPVTCKGKVQHCAARSTCGKAGAVTCTRTFFGTCDTETQTCTDGSSATGTCVSDSDCVVRTRCSTMRSEERCVAVGGVAGTGTCCAACEAPLVP